MSYSPSYTSAVVGNTFIYGSCQNAWYTHSVVFHSLWVPNGYQILNQWFVQLVGVGGTPSDDEDEGDIGSVIMFLLLVLGVVCSAFYMVYFAFCKKDNNIISVAPVEMQEERPPVPAAIATVQTIHPQYEPV